MIKLMAIAKRKQGMPVAVFQKHWREVHGPLVVEGLPGLRRYVQCHVLPETYGTARAPDYDGVPEAWFDSMDAYPATLGGRHQGESERASSADAVNFLEPGP